MYDNTYDSADSAASHGTHFDRTDDSSIFMRVLRRVEQFLRPALGWAVLLSCLALAWLPGEAAHRNEWLTLRAGPTIEPIGPLAVIIVWLLLGWRRATERALTRRARVGLLLMLIGIGLLAVSQVTVRWLPGVGDLVQTVRSGAWFALAGQIAADFVGLGMQLLRWWQGVLAGGATQDDLVFATLAGLLLWTAGCLTAWLARRTHNGLLAALPPLWLLGLTILYGPIGRTLIIAGLMLAVALHLALDQQRLVQRWQRIGLDYNPGIFLERLFFIIGAGVLIFSLAGIFPSVAITPISSRYYRFFSPFNDRVETFGERMFPDLKATSRFRSTSVAGGLPNDFLLGSGPELSRVEVMRVRTDEPIFFDPAMFEEVAPRGHYMRGGTLSTYDGLGWENPSGMERENMEGDSSLDADETITIMERSVDEEDLDGELPPGRRLLTQDVFLTFSSYALYAAPEPLIPSVDYRVEQRAPGDWAALWVNAPNRRVRSYTVVSAVPAVSHAQLTAEPAWGEQNLLPEGYEVHLQLPDTISDRTRELADELTADLDSPYAKAQAIEAYLREFEYDLAVDEPPDNVTDVADYFLFELQRGYCDYYATAFIVLARLAGLPARFATGFASGIWNPGDGMYMITEAEAHSWPEIYFPTYGWIPFEPTAGRAPLDRIGLPDSVDFTPATGDTQAAETAAVDDTTFDWNWQMLVWLLPLGLLLWGVYFLVERWRSQRDEPWQGVLRWGRRVGRPLHTGETVLEYGDGLADYTVQRQTGQQDMGRLVAREVQALSVDVSSIHYGVESERAAAASRAQERWQVLRGYLRRLRIK